MRYVLGVHLGATRTTAAVCRSGTGPWGEPEVVPLEEPWLESVLHVSPDGELRAGQAALHRAAAEPERIARSPLRRIGDTVPFVLGELTYPAETLAAGLLALVADRVADSEGADAERIVVTHPPGWGGYRRGLLHEALDQAQLPGVLALPSPIAAAESHAEVAVGATLAVCRIGGTHVETALLRRGPRGFELLAHTEPPELAAGAHLDELLVQHVLERASIDRQDTGAMARLRAACTSAKERLSQVGETTVFGDLRLTRAEFEELARPVLEVVVAAFERLVSTVAAEQLAGALVVGGTARIPLVRELAEAVLPCPVVIGDDPGTALCRGAALAARPRVATAPAPASTSSSLITTGHDLPAVYGGGADLEPPPARPPVEITPLEPPRRRFALGRRASTERDEDR
ncbi:Hsp70 family protein [Saccharomonospora sp. NPDC046836]|uniref:Hsp70 family protein n=1 Tax=Saccharomonospora sp. NPDC046836 TaxID=3156921 RepID=UPI0033CA27D6